MKKDKAYIRLYEDLKKRILEGRIKHMEKLPSKRQLAEDFGLSLVTVEHALNLLIDEGYIAARQRSGYYVIYTEAQIFDDKAEHLSGYSGRSASFSEEDSFRLTSYIKAVRKTISDRGEEILVKSANSGCERLRTAIASYLFSDRGIRVLPEQIIVGAGAEYLYGLLVLMLGRDKKYGTEDPCYEKIEKVYSANMVKVIKLSLGKNGINSRKLWNSDFDVLHVSPYRSFPSGVSADASKRREYIRWLKAGDERVIIEDDFESEFYPEAKPAETLFSIAAADAQAEGKESRVIYVNTFSKTISASIRTGYMVLPKSLIPVYERKAGFYSCAVPALEQHVIAELIENGDFVKNINRIRRRNRL